MLDVSEVTLEEVDAEIEHTVAKLERLSKLREAVNDQNQRRIKKLLDEYRDTLAKEKEAKTP